MENQNSQHDLLHIIENIFNDINPIIKQDFINLQLESLYAIAKNKNLTVKAIYFSGMLTDKISSEYEISDYKINLNSIPYSDTFRKQCYFKTETTTDFYIFYIPNSKQIAKNIKIIEELHQVLGLDNNFLLITDANQFFELTTHFGKFKSNVIYSSKETSIHKVLQSLNMDTLKRLSIKNKLVKILHTVNSYLQKENHEQITQTEYYNIHLSDLSNRVTQTTKSKLKVINNQIDHSFNTFSKKVKTIIDDENNKVNIDVRTIIQEVDDFEHFKTENLSSMKSLVIPPNYVEKLSIKIQRSVEEQFTYITHLYNINIADLLSKTKGKLAENNIEQVDIKLTPLHKNNISEYFQENNFGDKEYSKSLMDKGMSAIFMKIRYPLIMLMPFMLLFGLFSTGLKSDDKGTIDETVINYNGQQCILISKMPSFYYDLYQEIDIIFAQFESNLTSSLRKGIFSKNDALTLQVRKEVRSGPLGSETVLFPVTMYDYKNETVKLFIQSDRDIVIKELLNPQNNLLMQDESKSGRMMFGIMGFIRLIDSFKYKKILLILISLGLFFGIRALIRGYKRDREVSMQKEQEKLREKLSDDLEKHYESLKKNWITYVSNIYKNNTQFLKAKITTIVDRDTNQIYNSIDKKQIVLQYKQKVNKKKINELSSLKKKIDAYFSQIKNINLNRLLK